MKAIFAYRFDRRTLLALMILMLVAVGFSMATPQRAQACCVGWDTTTTYWADAGHTIYCGECERDCDGILTCSGNTSCPYRTVSRVCCGPCQP